MKRGLIIVLLGCLTACTVIEEDSAHRPDPVAGAKSRVGIAAEYIQKGELEPALRNLQKALELDPKSPEAYNMLGVLMERDGDLAKAEENYRKAIRLNSSYSQAHNNYGVLLYRLQRYKDAIQELDKAASDIAYDNRDMAYYNLGLAALAGNEKAKARYAFERAVRVNTRFSAPVFELATLSFDQKDIPAATNYYRGYLRLLGKQPQSARSLLLGIRLAQQQHDTVTMSGYIQTLKQLYPDSPEYQGYLKEESNGS